MWSPIKSQILVEAIKDASFITIDNTIVKPPLELEKAVNKLNQLFGEIKRIFGINDLLHNSDISMSGISYTIYDSSFYKAIIDYLKSTHIVALQYVIKPQLSDQQLTTIKCVIETTTRFMSNSMLNENVKRGIIEELAKTYDLSNDKFINSFENIFVELQENLQEEKTPRNNRMAMKIAKEIQAVIPTIDSQLFVKLTLTIRSLIVYTPNDSSIYNINPIPNTGPISCCTSFHS